MIVAIEGMDGAGKTTICEYIEKKYNFINIEKPTKYLFEDKSGKIDYPRYYETLEMIYQTDDITRTKFFGKGNIIAVTKFPNQDIVLDRHLASNYYWNGNSELDEHYRQLIDKCGKPDITIFLYATPFTRYKRLRKRNMNDVDLKDSTIFADGTKKNIDFLIRFNLNHQIINTDNKTIAEVCHEVDRIMMKLITKKNKKREKKLMYEHKL